MPRTEPHFAPSAVLPLYPWLFRGKMVLRWVTRHVTTSLVTKTFSVLVRYATICRLEPQAIVSVIGATMYVL